MSSFLKSAVHAIALLLAFPAALLCGFGRIRAAFTVFAHLHALYPGLPGDYLRAAFYHLTLRRCSMRVRISFGSFFAHPDSTVEDGVYIGSYCIIGKTRIGARTQIASHVNVLSGRRQHGRDSAGNILGADTASFAVTEIGRDCWIGSTAIIMENIGAGTTIGAGSVVTKPIPAGVVAVGNPAKVIRTTTADTPASSR